jgi:hypothetical protein
VPGFVTVLALSHVETTTKYLLANPTMLNAAGAVWLLAIAIVSGGVVDAIRRTVVDRLIVRLKPIEPWQNYLTPQNRELFAEEGVQNSYKYYEFYANFALSIVALLALRRFGGPLQLWPVFKRPTHLPPVELLDVLLAGTLLALCGAAWTQWGYFVDFIAGFITSQKKGERPMLMDNPPTGTRVRTISDIENIPRGTEGRLRGTTGYPDDRPDDIFVVEFPEQNQIKRARRDQIEETMRW